MNKQMHHPKALPELLADHFMRRLLVIKRRKVKATGQNFISLCEATAGQTDAMRLWSQLFVVGNWMTRLHMENFSVKHWAVMPERRQRVLTC